MSDNDTNQCEPNTIGCPFNRGEFTPELWCLYSEIPVDKCLEEYYKAYPDERPQSNISIEQPKAPVDLVRTGGEMTQSSIILMMVFGLVLAHSIYNLFRAKSE